MITFWSYWSTCPWNSHTQPHSHCAWSCYPMFGMPTSSDSSLRVVILTLLHVLWIPGLSSWWTCWDTGWTHDSSWRFWKKTRWALPVVRSVLAEDSMFNTFAESMSYQPWRARYVSICFLLSRLVHYSLCFSICQMQFTLLVDQYATLTLPIYSQSKIAEMKISSKLIHQFKSEICLLKCIFGYPKQITLCFNGFLELPNDNCMQHFFNHDRANRECLRDPHLLIQGYTLYLSL